MTRRQFPRSATDRALLEAVLAAPDDDTPRLVYADRLTELGDPRGELIVVQCERTRREQTGEAYDDGYRALRIREAELHREHYEYWRQSFDGGYWVSRFERGFVSFIGIDFLRLRYRWSLFAAHPLKRILFFGHMQRTAAESLPLGDLAWLARKPVIQRAHEIELASMRGRLVLDAGAMCRAVAGIDPSDPVGSWPEGSILPVPRLRPALRRIGASTPPALEQLLDTPDEHLGGVTDVAIDVPYDDRQPQFLDFLRTPLSRRVDVLRFSCTTTRALIEPLADARATDLSLQRGVNDDAMHALEESPIAPRLRRLRIGPIWNQPQPLFRGAFFPKVERLKLQKVRIEENLAETLPRVFDLHLHDCTIADAVRAPILARWPDALSYR